MASPKETKLTFAVTLTQPKGVTIPQMRQFLVESISKNGRFLEKQGATITEDHFDGMKCHLTNKEVHYG